LIACTHARSPLPIGAAWPVYPIICNRARSPPRRSPEILCLWAWCFAPGPQAKYLPCAEQPRESMEESQASEKSGMHLTACGCATRRKNLCYTIAAPPGASSALISRTLD